MDDLISRQAVLYAINKTYEDTVKGIDRHSTVHGLISAVTGIYKNTICLLPPVQPERKKGKWIPSDSQCGIRCSACGVPVDDFCHSIDYIDLDYEPNFCPNCGAKMKGDAE